MSSEPLNAIVFDLGDVLFSWSSQTKTGISSKVLHQILSTPTWFDYECGRLGEQECYDLVAREFSLDPADVGSAFRQARESLEPNDQLVSLIRELRAQSNGTLRVYAMSNISAPDYEYLRTTKHVDWSIFDRVFSSAAAGERKPNLAFYTHVVGESGLDPCRSVFVDDKVENVLSARSLGFYGIIFDSADSVARQLRNLCGSPEARGIDYLRRNAGGLNSETDTGVVIHENFAQLLIYEATKDVSLVSLANPARTWNFFRKRKGVLTKEDFPNDLDTTSLGLTMFPRPPDVVHSVMDEMLGYINPDGIIQTYFDHTRPRFDACVCERVDIVLHIRSRCRAGSYARLGAPGSAAPCISRRHALLHDCRMFPVLSRTPLTSCSHSEIHNKLESLFKERVQERIGAEGDALALGMRIVACAAAGVADHVDMRTLLSMQCDDGGWEIGWVYKLVAAKTSIGSRGLATAVALQAISSSRALSQALRAPAAPVEAPQESDVSALGSNLRSFSPLSSIRRLVSPPCEWCVWRRRVI